MTNDDMNFSMNPINFRNKLCSAEKNNWNTNHGGRYFPAVVLSCRYSDVQRFQTQCQYLK